MSGRPESGAGLRTLIPDPDPVPLTRPALTRRFQPPAILVVRFGVGGRPRQWVTFGAKAGTSKVSQRVEMRAWQCKVAMAAALAMRRVGGPVQTGPVGVWIDAVFQPNSRAPDRDNVQKSTVDALQGIVYANDNQVIDGECRRIIGPYEGAVIEVWTTIPVVLG